MATNTPTPVTPASFGGQQAATVTTGVGDGNDGAERPHVYIENPATGKPVGPSNPLPVYPTTGAAGALTSPPAALTANTDTSFTFSSQVNHILVQNNSGTAVGIALDTAATAGSYQIPGGGGGLLLDVPVTVVHLYSAAATPVNGSAASNIVLLGWG